MKINPEMLSLIKELAEAKAPSGFEDETIAVARKYLSKDFNLEEDSLRNLCIRRKRDKGDKPVFLLDAHSDEVGFMVHSIKPEGVLRFVELGNWNKSALPGTKVLVRNRFGEWINGVIAAKPPHFMSDEERARNKILDVNQLVIDVGAVSYDEAVNIFHIRIGEPCVAATRFEYDAARDIMFGKGFDCRIGCAALIKTMLELKDKELPFDIVGLLSSQEEVGERGCGAAIERIKPDIAVCFEGCPADDTFGEKYAMQTLLKRGPMLRFIDRSIICNPRFQRFALDLAAEKEIPAQASVREGGGNNAAKIQYFKGAPSIVLGIPVRYIHCPACITSYADFESGCCLASAIAEDMTLELLRSF